MRLSELVQNGGPPPSVFRDVDVTGLAADSRDVRPGYLFAALNGTAARGTDFIPDALDHGAVAVLMPADAEAPAPVPDAVPLVRDANPRRRFAQMAARFYGRQPRVVAAVTGTNGKSSVAAFTRQIWQAAGLRAGSMGTLGIDTGDTDAGTIPVSIRHTTPDPVTLHAALAALADAGVDHLAIEASSHGLDQHRLDGVAVIAGAFLNITHDHLDYHDSADAYFHAKAGLFERVMAPGGTAVLNADMPEFPRLKELCRARQHRLITFGSSAADLTLVERHEDGFGQRLVIEAFGERHEIFVALPGGFQASNMMAAAGLAIATGVAPDQAIAALGQLKGVPGRLEIVAHHPNGAPVVVDYAHTPDALSAALDALRPYVRGQLVVVFGCGGDRDREKRLVMGGIAAARADTVIVTDDNPRSEDAAAIRAEIMTACPGAAETGDRARAIGDALAMLGPGDVLLVAGKGHETGQTIGDTVIPFDDAAVAREAAHRLEEAQA